MGTAYLEFFKCATADTDEASGSYVITFIDNIGTVCNRSAACIIGEISGQRYIGHSSAGQTSETADIMSSGRNINIVKSNIRKRTFHSTDTSYFRGCTALYGNLFKGKL